MQRRAWMKATGAAAAAAFEAARGRAAAEPVQGRAALETEVVRLRLRHTWTTTMSSSEYRDTLHVRFTRDGVTGTGEGAPIVRYHENAQDAQKALEAARGVVLGADPWLLETTEAEAFRQLEGQYAARAALDIALHDWIGQRLSIPVYRLLGLDPGAAPITTFSIGIDRPDLTRQMKEALSNPGIHHKFVKGLESRGEVRLYRKSGTWQQFHSDSALVEGPNRRYVLVGLADQAEGGEWLVRIAVPVDDLIDSRHGGTRTPQAAVR